MSAQQSIGLLKHYINQLIIGQDKLVNRLLIALLADGHLLVEGVPGLAKTRAIKVLSEGVEGDFHRIQFTPDLLPADLTGPEIYRPQDGSFKFQRGPLFHNLILADEINRAPAKVQRLAADRDRLKDDSTRLAALVQERQKNQAAAEKDMDAEKQRAIALSKQTEDLQGLIGKMEQDVKSAAKAAAAAELQGTPASLNGKPDLSGLKDPGRLSPAIAFASAKGLLPMPVNGTKIRNFGGSDGAAGQEKGISIATRPERAGHNPV